MGIKISLQEKKTSHKRASQNALQCSYACPAWYPNLIEKMKKKNKILRNNFLHDASRYIFRRALSKLFVPQRSAIHSICQLGLRC